MPGGLLNLVSYGNENLILTGNPSKTFFKCAYAKYTNFGLQKFRLDFDGQRSLRETQPSVLRFKIPRYGDLLMDTYLVVTLPTIWSTILPPQNTPTQLQQIAGIGPPIVQDHTNVWSPYEFKWIKNIGTQMIKEVKFMVGSQIIQKFTGDYLHALVERDFDDAKKDLYYKMTGNIDELNDPANSHGRKNAYPNVWPTQSKNYSNLGPEPSIRSRKLYIPLNIWFTLASKMAFPLVSLQYNELHVEITLRPVNELFVIRDIEKVGTDIRPTRGAPVGNYIQPNFNNQLHQFYRFIQPPPNPTTDPNSTLYTSLRDIIQPDYYIQQRNNWAADIHAIATYAFLSDEEVKAFALQPQNYLIKEVYQTEYKNVVGTQKVKLETGGMVSNWMWYFQRTDAFLRNEWSNYTNWPYSNTPNNLVDALDYNNIPDESLPNIPGEYYESINIAFLGDTDDVLNGIANESIDGTYNVTIESLNRTGNYLQYGRPLTAEYKSVGSAWQVSTKGHPGNFFTSDLYLKGSALGDDSIKLTYNLLKGAHYYTNNDTTYHLSVSKVGNSVFVYQPPKSIGQPIPFGGLCDSDSATSGDSGYVPGGITRPSDSWWNIPDTFHTCSLTPSYNPWYVEPDTSNNILVYPNLPYYKTDFKITGDFDAGNEKDIMITWGLLMDGKYRENELDAGVLNYVEKYVRTSGNAPDGLYCYNFALQSSPFIFQPSGAMNLNKFKTVEFEVSTFSPPSDPNAETLTICDSDGNIIGVNKPVWRIYDYTYNLVVMEERYNVLKFVSGNAALAYTR